MQDGSRPGPLTLYFTTPDTACAATFPAPGAAAAPARLVLFDAPYPFRERTVYPPWTAVFAVHFADARAVAGCPQAPLTAGQGPATAIWVIPTALLVQATEERLTPGGA